MKIIVVDYGLGNLYNLANAFQCCGQTVQLTRSVEALLEADALILPGVGAFGDGMARLKEWGLDKAIQSFAATQGTIMGICLGMQLLMDWSEEFGFHEGLGLIKGGVKHLKNIESFDKEAKVPHVGWNDIQIREKTHLLEGLTNRDMYFVHSYCAVTDDQSETLATVSYGGAELTAIIGKGNIYGCQFHPEKSSQNGIQILRNFINMVVEVADG